MLATVAGAAGAMEPAHQALEIARDVDDPALLARTLTACGLIAGYYDREVARPHFAEAIGLARALDERWRLSQILAWQANVALVAGDPIAARAPAEEGRDLADAIGDGYNSRSCRHSLGWAQTITGDLAGAVAQLGKAAAKAKAAHDEVCRVSCQAIQGIALAYRGKAAGARAAADAAFESASEIGELFVGLGHLASGFVLWPRIVRRVAARFR